MTKFIVHIGPHKTGTTYLQITLDALRDALLQQGVCFPTIWKAAPGLPSHMQLVWALRNGNLKLIQSQVQEILAQRHPVVVISCEGLSRLNQDQIFQLRTVLGSASVQVVYYVRRWPERLPSLWQETVKFGHVAAFTEFLSQQLTNYDHSDLWDAPTIDRFSLVFGAHQVKVVSYSHLTEQNIDICRHFITSFLGLNNITLPTISYPNQSLPIVETELIRALNAIHLQCGGAKSTALREWFLTHKDRLVPDALMQAMRNNLNVVNLDEAAPPFALVAPDLLARYGASIVPPRHSSGLHQLRAVDAAFISQDYLLEPGIVQILRGLYRTYRRGR